MIAQKRRPVLWAGPAKSNQSVAAWFQRLSSERNAALSQDAAEARRVKSLVRRLSDCFDLPTHRHEADVVIELAGIGEAMDIL